VAVLAAVLFVVTPSTLQVAGFAMADLGVVFWCLAAFSAWIVWAERQVHWALVICGLELGLAIGAKYTAALVGLVPVLILTVVWKRAASLRTRLVCALVVGGLALAAFGPWLLRNGIETGNPIYPYFFSARPEFAVEHDFRKEVANRLDSSGADGSYLVHVLLGPYELLTTGVGAMGLLGTTLLLPLALLALRRRLERRTIALLALGGCGFVCWDLTAHLTRYALPFLACLAVPAAVALYGEPVSWRRRLLAACVALGLLTNLLTAWMLTDWGAVRSQWMGTSTREDYLAQHVAYYPAVEFANQNLTATDRILFFGEARGFYCEIPHVVSGARRRPLLLEIAERTSAGAASTPLVTALRQRGFTHILVGLGEVARLHGEDWFARLDPAARRSVAHLLQHELKVLFDDGHYQLGRLSDTAEPTADQAAQARPLSSPR
jgi:hypothetical protein